MKKILLSVVSAGIFVSSYGQSADGGGTGIEIGLRGAAASNWLFNANVSNAGSEQDYSAAFSYNYGIDFAFDINEHIAIEANLLLGTITQGYTGTFQDAGHLYNTPKPYFYIANESYTAKNQLNITGIPLLFRFGSGNGSYVEIGPEYDIVTGATYTANYTGEPALSPSHVSYSVANAFATSNIQGVLGFGDDFQIGSSGFNIITNLRFYYGFTDLKGADGLGQNMDKTINGSQNGLYTTQPGQTAPYYSSYKATHSVGASFSIGLYYYFGFAKSEGGRHACKHPPAVKD